MLEVKMTKRRWLIISLAVAIVAAVAMLTIVYTPEPAQMTPADVYNPLTNPDGYNPLTNPDGYNPLMDPDVYDSLTDSTGYSPWTNPYLEILAGADVDPLFKSLIKEIDALDECEKSKASIGLYGLHDWEEPAEGSHWAKDTNYRLCLHLPDRFLRRDNDIVVHVDYPDRLEKGERGTITMIAKDREGCVYREVLLCRHR